MGEKTREAAGTKKATYTSSFCPPPPGEQFAVFHAEQFEFDSDVDASLKARGERAAARLRVLKPRAVEHLFKSSTSVN